MYTTYVYTQTNTSLIITYIFMQMKYSKNLIVIAKITLILISESWVTFLRQF